MNSRRIKKCMICTKLFPIPHMIRLDAVVDQDPYRTVAEAFLEFANVDSTKLVLKMDAFVCINHCYQRLMDGIEFQSLVSTVFKQLAGNTEQHAFSEEHDFKAAFAETKNYTTSLEIVEVSNWDEKDGSAMPTNGTVDIQMIYSEAKQNEEIGRPFVKPAAEFISTHMKFQNFDYFELRGHRCCGCACMAKSMQELLEHAADCHTSGGGAGPDHPHVCSICSTAFETEQHLYSHNLFSREKEVFVCKCCSQGFRTKQQLMKHMMLYSSEENDDTLMMDEYSTVDSQLNSEYVVEELNEEHALSNKHDEQGLPLEDQYVTRQEDYDEYCILHTEGERCCSCGKFFADYVEMLAHATATHRHSKSDVGRTHCTCEACGESFQSQKSLKQHHATNRSYKTIFYCKLCKMSFVRIHLLARHILTSLKHCPNGTENVLEKHHSDQMAAILRAKAAKSRVFTGFGCCFVRCGATFDDEKQLQNHVEELHAVRRRIHISERTSNQHVCEVCGLGFTKEQNLLRHRYGWKMRKVNICSYCGKGFPNPAVLREHEQVEHTDPMPQFECEHCGKRFKKKSLIKLHLVTHEEGRRFGCDQCGARFRFGHQLKKHQNSVHAVELPYECKYCECKMSNKQRYDQHMRKHTGERPYECRHGCGRTFSHTTDRRRHEMATHTGEKPHSCPSCEIAYVRRRELQIHYQKNPDHNIETSTHVFDQAIVQEDNIKAEKLHQLQL